MATEPTRIPQTQKMELWLADLVCPVEGAPIRRGAILTASGRVLAVGDEAFVRPSIPVAEERDFGRAILIPGLVNAHTHLELSGIERESGPMEEWIVSLVREVRGWPAHLFLASARIGVAASLAAGVTCVGDVSISGESATAIAGGGMRGVVFHEVLGLDPERADDILAQKLKDQALFPEYKGAIPDAVRHGLSPHAPYTASLGLYRAVRDEARARGWPVATHLGESAGEVEFLQEGGGALARAHRELNGSLDGFKPSGLRPVAHLDLAGALDGLALAVHANQTNAEEWRLLRKKGVRVCLCPRSARFFGHPFADAARMREAGLDLCLGTDSLASSPTLSLLDEARALREMDEEITDAELLDMCTRAGAKALGFDNLGVLKPGGAADFCAVCPPPGLGDMNLGDVFEAGAFVVCTVTGGEIRYEAPSL